MVVNVMAGQYIKFNISAALLLVVQYLPWISMSCPSLCSLVLKTSIDPSLYSHVDSALKRLKLVSRRLSAVLTIWGEESRVLDRLYYKGKNQHRTSLFWRHVEEMQRFCLRVNSLDLVGTLNRLRHSFYDSVDYNK